MKKLLMTLAALFAFCIPGLSQYKFVDLFTPPNGSNPIPVSINNSGKILATYSNSRGQRKLIFAGVNGFTNINIPLDTSTTSLYPNGFNAGGDLYGEAIRRLGPHSTVDEGFIICHTDPIRYFKVPNAARTVITGINDKHEVLGFYVDPEATPISPGPGVPPIDVFRSHGFKSVIQNSGFFPATQYFDVANETYPTGINNNGDITGWWRGLQLSDDVVDGFGFLISKGQTSVVEVDRWHLYPSKINIHGVMVGFAIKEENDHYGFILENGVLTIVNYPGFLPRTVLSDINDSGAIVGSWNPELDLVNESHGFILTKQ